MEANFSLSGNGLMTVTIFRESDTDLRDAVYVWTVIEWGLHTMESGPIKKPASAGFNVTGSRDSVAYPFLSPHRLGGVLMRLLISCFCWCCDNTIQS
ncbi:hypothetical protein FEK50_16310 [Escherichia sp. E2586]|nr:hypothetical protein D9737_21125 [Escherichia sp. E10V4]TGC01214.1 hypothetical protein CRG92_08570 [Escherichia sp. E2586]TLI71428.1 hypothetical protein FEK50_16310 [Escherichia sp. E2586]